MKVIKLDDGKYEFHIDDNTGLMIAAFRNGEPWDAGWEMRFMKVFMCALNRVHELEGEKETP